MNRRNIAELVNDIWDKSIIPELIKYIKIPNKSPMFDPDWERHGYMSEAVVQIKSWCEQQPINGMTVDVVTLEGRTPVLYIEIPGQGNDCILIYGHLDKQPEMTGWREGLGPWTPVIKDGKLYGRGGADDGYSTFAAVTAIQALHEQSIPHARCIILIESCEESGSFDLPYYIDSLADRIGTPNLVVCLDSGCGNYEQLWCTTSLRGSIGGILTVQNLKEGVHSGDAGGIIPSTFRILRQLLSRVENEDTGSIHLEGCNVEIPEQRKKQAEFAAQVLGTAVYDKFPLIDCAKPSTQKLADLVLNRTWRAALEITGGDGLPPSANAGNVARPYTTARISIRIPPTCDPVKAAAELKLALERDPPYNSVITFDEETPCVGWDAPPLAPWLEESADQASKFFFGKQAAYMGEGGSIPFMGMLGERFPNAQFLITGVLGPHSNAHGPNEFLHLEAGKRVTSCIAVIIAEHFRRLTA